MLGRRAGVAPAEGCSAARVVDQYLMGESQLPAPLA